MLSQAFEPPRRVLSFGRNLSCNLTARASSVRARVSLRRTADYEQHM